MKKKNYIAPRVEVLLMNENVMAAVSIQNAQGFVQDPVIENEDNDFVGGAKRFNAWDAQGDTWEGFSDDEDDK